MVASGGIKENAMTTDTAKTVETTELSQDQLDLVAGGIYFEGPKLQTALSPVVWNYNEAIGIDRLVNLPFGG
jgi:hypothetical protein